MTSETESSEANRNLADAITRLSRTQFKGNTLLEAQSRQLDEILAILKTSAQGVSQTRANETAASLQAIRQEARTDMLLSLLPVLDGIQTALESGRTIAQEASQPSPQPWQNTLWSCLPLFKPTLPDRRDSQLVGWLEGLALIQERFLHILESEGVILTAFVGQPFDPAWHIALEVSSQEKRLSSNPLITKVFSQGYRQLASAYREERVLRYAEVAVAK